MHDERVGFSVGLGAGRTGPNNGIKHLGQRGGGILCQNGCDPKMRSCCITLRLLLCSYLRHFLVVRIAQNAVDFSVFKGVGSQILGDRRLA